MKELKQDLWQRKFPILLIQDGISKAMEKDTYELRKVKDKSNKNKMLLFVSTFNPNNPEVFGIIQQNKHILEKSDIMKAALKEKPLWRANARPGTYNISWPEQDPTTALPKTPLKSVREETVDYANTSLKEKTSN